MVDSRELNVFISWSGELAREVALHLHELLPTISDLVTPWMSDADIESGARGLEDIGIQLDGSSFGLIVVTRANQNSQWLNFEAGALSKRLSGPDTTRVVPVLVDLDSVAELTGPLTQFQARLMDRPGLSRVLKTMGDAVGINPDVIERRLAAEWEEFDAHVQTARSRTRHPSAQPKRGVESMVEEALELLRTMSQDSLRAQESIRPSESISAEARSRRAASLRHAVSAGLAHWGTFVFSGNFTADEVLVDVQDPDNQLDHTNPDVYTAVARALRSAGFKPTLTLSINGNYAIPF